MARRVRRTELAFRMTMEHFSPQAPVTYTWIEPYLRVNEIVRELTVKLQQERVPTLSRATHLIKLLFAKFRLVAEDRRSVQWLEERGFYQVRMPSYFLFSPTYAVFPLSSPRAQRRPGPLP